MKAVISLLIFIFGVYGFGQSLTGAWERVEVAGSEEVRYVMIFANTYVISSAFDANSGGFINTRFERWSMPSKDSLKVVLEFDSEYPEAVGGDYIGSIDISEDRIIFDGIEWTRIDEQTESNLAGAWTVVARRSMEGQMESRSLNQPLKRFKLLSGSRFHWLEYDADARIFSGTGGGTYVLDGDEYVEFIEFYANDPGYVGDSVRFKMKIENGKWFHKGLLGQDEIAEVIDEIWMNIQ